MTRTTLAALTVVCALLFGVAAGAAYLIGADRARLRERFAAERLVQAQQAAELSAADLDGVAALLHLADNLWRSADRPESRGRELQALLSAGDHFRALRVFGAEGEELIAVDNPRIEREPFESEPEEQMRLASLRSLSRAGELDLSQPIPTPSGRTYRVYALSTGGGAAGPETSIAVLVDSGRLLSKLGVLASDPAVQVVFLGPHGAPTPSTDPALAEAALTGDPGRLPAFSALLGQLRDGRSGTRWIGASESEALGMGDADVLAAFAPVRTGRLGQWSLALLTSTSVLTSAQQSITGRLTAAAVAVAVLLLSFLALVARSERRAALARERLLHAERLQRLHERTEKTLDNIPAAVMSLDAAKRLTSANQAVRQRLGDLALPCSLAAALPGAPTATVARLEGLLDEAVKKQQVQSLHGERLALFGAEGQYSVHAVPLGSAFDEARSMLVVEDVSEVRSLESQLLRAEKLATIGVLAAGLAHEVGTPLGIVRSRAEYVLSKLGASHPQARGVAVIIEQIDRVARTIRQMLDFSRVQPAAVRPVALKQAAAWLTDVLQYEVQRRKLTLVVTVSPSLPKLAADPDQLQQLLLNLAMNACDACRPDGQVAIGAREERSGEGWPCLRIEVADDGCGIPEEQRQGIFDPFFTTKKRGQGTGLGLTVAAQIARNHGAQIEVESEVGRGTRVTLFWPLAEAATEQANERAV